MLTKEFLKPQISIEKIGKFHFWAGIIIGVFSAFVFSFLFNYGRETFRYTTFVLNPYILSPKEFMLYDLFFAALSVSLAFGFTVIIWLTGRKKIKKQYYRMFAIGNAWLIVFVVLFLVLRLGSVLYFGIYIGFGYDGHFDFLKEFWIILILLPILIFFYNWNYLSLMFRTGPWLIVSLFAYAFLTFLLFKTTSVDKNILNNVYYKRNTQKFEYIESELSVLPRLYGITIADSTKEMLKKYYSDKTFNLVKRLKKAFETKGLVSLDTLILEKIVVHNLNIKGAFLDKHRFEDKDINWPYATPEAIYTQIKRYENTDTNGEELKFLIDILNEMIAIFQVPDIDWDKRYKYSDEDIKRYHFKTTIRNTTSHIADRLRQVVEKLRFDKDNKSYFHKLRRMEDEKQDEMTKK